MNEEQHQNLLDIFNPSENDSMYSDKDQYEKRRHATWYSLQGELHCICSYCCGRGYNYYKFCPNCGAEMNKEK